MKNFRQIYMVEAITENGELLHRSFYSQKRDAERAERRAKKKTGARFSWVRLLGKREWEYVDGRDVH